MSKDMRSSVAIRNAQLDAVTTEADGGFVRVYGGSRPASPDVAVTVQQLLSTLSLGAPAFGSASGGVAFANAIAPDTDIADTGTATVAFRDLGDTKDRVTAAVDGSGNRTTVTRDAT